MSMKAKKSKSFDREVIKAGTYRGFKLDRITCMMGKPTKWAPDGAPKLMFVYSRPRKDKDPFEVAHFLSLPKEFQYHKKGKIWGHLGELVGETISDKNAEEVEFDAGDFISSYDELMEAINTADDKGNLEKVDMGVSYKGVALVGREYTLTLGVWTNDADEKGNEIKAINPSEPVKGGEVQNKEAPAAGTVSSRSLDIPDTVNDEIEVPMMDEDLPF